MPRHDRIHPLVTVADLPATVAFYRALGFEDVTSPAWAAAGAVTLAWQGCPQTFVPVASPLAVGAAPTEGFALIFMVEDLAAATAGFAAAGVAMTRGESPPGAYVDLVDPAGTTLRFIEVQSR